MGIDQGLDNDGPGVEIEVAGRRATLAEEYI